MTAAALHQRVIADRQALAAAGINLTSVGLHDGKVVVGVSNVDARVATEMRQRYPGKLIVVKLGRTFVPFNRGA
jgi:hypothetical protein